MSASITKFAVILLLGLSLITSVRAESQRPNIVFILADDLGWNALSCYGTNLVETPNLDRLADEGMRFTNAYALSQCLPTRAALFSGQYGARTGLASVEKESPSYAPLRLSGRPELLQQETYMLFESDPGESLDLSAEMPQKVEELMKDLESWWQETNARFPTPNPDMDRSQWIWNQSE